MPALTHEDPDAIDAAEQFKSMTLQKVNGLKCAAHGKPPVVAFHGSSLRDIRITMRSCCGQLSRLANEAIAVSGR